MTYILDRSPEGVVFASIEGARAAFGDTLPEDYRVTVRVTADDSVVGVTLDGMADEPAEAWRAHAVRKLLPAGLLALLDRWFSESPERRLEHVEAAA